MPETTDSPALSPLPDPEVPGQHPAVVEVAHWVNDFLAKPNEDLGRSGSVCPYVAPAMTRESIYVACELTEPDVAWGVERMRAYRKAFAERAATAGRERIFLAALVLFPELPASRYAEFIEGVQAELKGEFMSEGMMIGEFHPGPPPRPGLWNPDFRPFQAPVPLLAIRHMVAADVPFVKDSTEHLEIYLGRFADEVPRRLATQIPGHVTSKA